MRTLDISVQERASRTAAEWLWPLLPIGAAVFCLSALIYFHVQYEVVQVRSAMQVLVAAIYQSIGFAPAVMFFLLLLTWSSIWFVSGRLERPLMRVGRLLAMAVMLGVFLNLGDGGVSSAVHKGAVGAWFAGCLVAAIGYYPSIVLVWAVTFASLLLATDFFFSDSFEKLRQRGRPESGVETAVTDHLRGLGALAPIAEPVPRHAPSAEHGLPAAVAAAPELDFLREMQADESADDEPEFTPRRRRSYYERRQRDLDATDLDIEPAAAEVDALDVAAGAEWAPAAAAPAEPQGLDAEAVAAAAAAEQEDEIDVADEIDEGARDLVATAEADAEEDLGEPIDEAADQPPGPSFVAIEDDPVAVESASDSRELPTGVSASPEPEPIAEPEPELVAETEPEPEPEPDPEPVVAIPRPDHAPRERPTAPAVRRQERPSEAPVRQQKLFAAEVDEGLVQEAVELVSGQSRVTAALLQRRLRIDYQLAMDLMTQLGARGVVELEADASQGRVVV